ncbi:MAG: bifunctional DNA-formamidopyrimidine glycosylase/DNA-(apurinic or apyrimidinic site) lyase [Patescibacteria group bacterium]
MPELPEVETIKKDLNIILRGKKITAVEILEPKTVGFLGRTFRNKIEGKIIKSVGRRAKLLIMELAGGLYLVFHLKITGQLIISKAAAAPDKFTRVIFNLNNGRKLFFNDLRKFGYIKIFDKSGLEEMFKTMKYGPEPLNKDFTFKVFNSRLDKKKNAPIKPLLMDQGFISGIGNIYAAEACYYARIKPTRKVKTLTPKERQLLYSAIKKVLQASIKRRGTSADSYLDAHGQPGDFERFLKVYGRKGKKCFRCPGKVERIAQGGRGTFYCPKCQK